MDAEQIIEPTAEAEIQLCNYLDRRCWEVFAEIDEADRLNAFGTMIVVYDCAGDIPTIDVEFWYNTPGYETRYPEHAEEAKWNPCFWERASELLNFATDGGPELLQDLHDLYCENSVEFEGDYNGVIRFWGLVTGWAKRLKDNDRFKEMFPRSELLLVGNRAGDGANATRLVNGTVPSYIWSAGLG